MPDDERYGGTQSPSGNHDPRRRQPQSRQPNRQQQGGGEPPPRNRRRRSMEASGGLSVADLVQRHGSRPDLTPVAPPAPPADRQPPPRGAAPPPPPVRPARQQPPRPADGPPRPNGHPGRRPGETTGGPQWPGQAPEPGQHPRRQQPSRGDRPTPPPPNRAPGAPPREVGQRSEPGARPARQQQQRRGETSGAWPVDEPAGGTKPPQKQRKQPTKPPMKPAAQREPGRTSMPRRPNGTPNGRTNGAPNGAVPLPPPRKPHPDDDPVSMTTEMEAIGEDVQKRRSIDHTLARFSAVHDEIKAEERERKAKRKRLMPWQTDDADVARLDELADKQSIAPPPPPPQAPEPEPAPAPKAAEPKAQNKKPTRLQAKKNRRRVRSALAGRIVVATAAVLVLVATGVAWGFKTWIDSSSKQVDALDPNSAAIQDAGAQRGDENFLLVGSDTRAGAAAEEGVGDEESVGGARSDTVMIAHVPANRERVVVVSFPRDLEVTRPACEGWDPKTGDYTGEQHEAQEQAKINTAYQVGGPKCVTKMVQELSGLAINHFVGIDFHGFKGMVDAVDGVQVCVEQPLEDEVLGTVVPEAGKEVTITGDQALNFVRARHVKGDPTSDYGRIIRQQRFLSSLLRKSMSSEVLFDPRKLTNFVESFSKSTFGDNIGVEQLFMLGQSMQGLEAGRVTFITVPTVGEANDRGNEDLRVDDTNALFEAIRQDTPLAGETGKGANPAPKGQQLASGLQQQPPVDPATLKIQVLNGGNPTDGIAAATADKLTEFGFQIVRVDAATENVETTIVKYSKGNEAAAQTLASAVPGAQLVEDPSLAGALMLVVGPGFDGQVVAPTGATTGPEVPDNLSTVNAGDVACA